MAGERRPRTTHHITGMRFSLVPENAICAPLAARCGPVRVSRIDPASAMVSGLATAASRRYGAAMRHGGRVVMLAWLVALLSPVVLAGVARADGDPGSDVLVYQDLFAGSSAGLSVGQQAQLGDLLKAANTAHVPIRVAVISSPSDLGAVTGLWAEPRSYARFLGLELSLAYKQRLLVVMPNGFGFNWPGHSTAAAYATLARVSPRPSADLFAATQAAVQALAQAGGVKLATPTRGGAAAGTGSARAGAADGGRRPGARRRPGPAGRVGAPHDVRRGHRAARSAGCAGRRA